nr:dTMP kinase [Actinomyces bowdenii]
MTAARYPVPVTTAVPPAAPGAPAPRAPRPGLFISFEGGDGVGKTTQIAALAEHLEAQGVEHLVTREPGGTGLGAQIRGLLLDGGHVAPRAEALLYAADRAHHVETLVRPALDRGAVVLTDRYLDSSVAYQGAARSLGVAEVRDLSLWATGGLLPDLTILLDADPLLAARRTSGRGRADRLEREGEAFRAALREQFLALAAAEPQRFRLIDAARPVPEIAGAVRGAVEPLLAGRTARAGERA